jgi:hypothetical protein
MSTAIQSRDTTPRATWRRWDPLRGFTEVG